MATVNRGSTRTIDNRRVSGKHSRPNKPRDELVETYAGEENKGPASHKKESSQHSTKTKGRKSVTNPDPEDLY